MRSFLPTITTEAKFSHLSVQQTLSQYRLVQLQVHPLRLSSAHLHLLGCAFVDTPTSEQPKRPHIPPPATEVKESHQSPWPAAIPSPKEPCDLVTPAAVSSQHADTTDEDAETGTSLLDFLLRSKPPAHESWAKRIALCNVLVGKKAAMICLLEASPLAAKQSRRNVPFRYRAFKEPVLGIPFEAFSSSVPGPFCLYLDASAIRTARKEHLRSLYLQYPSQEKKHLYESHLAELTADIAPSRDPYVVVMLVALAQAQRRSVQSRDRSPPLTQHTFRVHALISDVNNSSYLRVYTAEVPDAFLDKLAYPRLPLTCDTSFRIEHATVPYEPYSTFQQRLMQAIPARGQKRARSCDTDEDDPYAETRWPMANPQGCVGRDGRKRLRAGSRAP